MSAKTVTPADARAAAIKAQLKALAPERSIWVAASAGTGKTTVLTSRVLSLMLHGTPPERILCLTFTKAAAAEMAKRIARRLKDWATVGEQKLDKELFDLLDRAPSEQERQLARQLFAQVLDLPGGLAIHTIHAFCQSLLARFPLEAGIAPHSALLEERAASELLVSLREELLSEAASGRAGALGLAVGHLARLVADQTFQTLIDLLSRYEDRFVEVEALVLPRLKATLGVEKEPTAAKLTTEICAEEAFDRPALEAALAGLRAGSPNDQRIAAKLEPWLAADAAGRAYNLKAYAQAFYKADGDPKAPDKLATKGTEKDHPGTVAALLAEQQRLVPLLARLKRIELYEANEALVRFGVELLNRYRAAKRERALLDYNDLIGKACQLLDPRNGTNAWVLYKLDGGLDHILVDESQDTNPQQWAVIEGLSADFFAGAGAHEEISEVMRTVFAVGDVKQSIFSFQGAEPRAFLEQRSEFRARAEAVDRGFENVTLSHSFRSAPVVLDLVDRVFATEEAQDGMTLGEAWPAHEATRLGQAGLIELWPLVGATEDDQSDPWHPPRTPEESASGEARLARQIAVTIAGWVNGNPGPGDPGWLEARGRPITPGDIMILVRRRNSFVREVIRALKVHDVPVAGVDRMILTEQLAVQDLVALGRAMLLPEDDLNLAGLLKSPLIGLTEAQLFTLAYDRGGKTLWSTLRDRRGDDPVFEVAAAMLEEMADKADYLTPFPFYAELLSAGGGRRKLLARLGEDAGDPIDEFLSQALLFERDNHPSLEGFLHWLAAAEHEVKRDLDQGGGQVRVMTVHGAKGLEAPVVFLPDTRQQPRGPKVQFYWVGGNEKSLPLWVPASEMEEEVATRAKAEKKAADLQEYRRLLYVALTRAEDRLYICGFSKKNDPKDEQDWYHLIAKALEGEVPEPFDFVSDLPEPFGWKGKGRRYRQSQEAALETAEPAKPGEAFKPLPAWAMTPAPEEPALLEILRPSGSEAGAGEPAASSPAPKAGEEISGIRRGLIIHRLLELLPALEPERQEELGARLLARPAEGLSSALQEALLAETLAVLHHPEFGPIFGPGSIAEAPVVGEIITRCGQKRLLSGQIDRLLVMENEILVVDYKTNRPPPTEESAVSPAYLGQMAAYRAVLREIYPGREIKAALLWTDEARLMHISHEVMDQHAP